MNKLPLEGLQERWDQPALLKTPDDVYRVELRLTMWPDDGRYTVAVEATHEHTRELIAWKMAPGRDLAHVQDELDEWLAEVKYRVLELSEPF